MFEGLSPSECCSNAGESAGRKRENRRKVHRGRDSFQNFSHDGGYSLSSCLSEAGSVAALEEQRKKERNLAFDSRIANSPRAFRV